MSKVIVERPRAGSRNGNDYKGELRHKQRQEKNNFEDAPHKENMKFRNKMTYSVKELNEHLGPLRRFLQSKVGQFWNKVYAEIRANLKVSSAVQLHILQHLDQYVSVQAVSVERGRFLDAKGEGIYDMYVVDPRNGCLAENPRARERYGSLSSLAIGPKYTTIDGKKYFEYKDVWYEVELQPLQKVPYSYYSYTGHDVFLKKTIEGHEAHEMYGVMFSCTKKTQLNSREIKKLGLRK